MYVTRALRHSGACGQRPGGNGKVKPDSAQLGLPSSSCVTGTETRMHATNAAHGLPWFRAAPLTRLTESKENPPANILCILCQTYLSTSLRLLASLRPGDRADKRARRHCCQNLLEPGWGTGQPPARTNPSRRACPTRHPRAPHTAARCWCSMHQPSQRCMWRVGGWTRLLAAGARGVVRGALAGQQLVLGVDVLARVAVGVDGGLQARRG